MSLCGLRDYLDLFFTNLTHPVPTCRWCVIVEAGGSRGPSPERMQ